jgi:hypothetical protein
MIRNSNRKQVIDIEHLVSCLPGYESFDVNKLKMKPHRKFIVRSTTELMYEKHKKEGCIVWNNNSL